MILKYPVRVALNPFASTIGYLFPYLVSGSIIVSLVLSLPTVGPLLLRALIAQDMFLAGTIMLLLGIMTVIGTFISDLVLMWLDPRIRFQLRLRRCTDCSRRPVQRRGADERCRRGTVRGRDPAAAHLVALPPAPARGRQRRRRHPVLSRRDLRRLPRLRRSARHRCAAQLHAAAGDPPVRRRRVHARMSTALQATRDLRTFKLMLRDRRRRKVYLALFARRLSVRAVRLVPDQPPPARPRRPAARRDGSSCSAPTCSAAICGRGSWWRRGCR